MVEEKTEKIIHELIDEIKQKYPDFRGIYLFGSRARGDFREDSDYDLAIIFNRNLKEKLKREVRNIIFTLMIKYNVIIDNPFLNNIDLTEPITPLRENIKYEGIFYEAA
ncbi:MAG: nucleotidyltransferase domain-containing protein [Candidatus Kapabacteria bacterium]|nr:nucleotidyltransferase domain-containing protein [Candidatus Kapabacteria bacterium]